MNDLSEHSRSFEEKLRIIAQTGLVLVRTTRLESIVQRATDAGLQVAEAQLGSFVYNLPTPTAESCTFYHVAAGRGNRTSVFPERNEASLGPAIRDRTIVRSRNIARDTRFRGPLKNDGMPHSSGMVSSYLVVPVRSAAGEILGALVYGHEEGDMFDDSSELLIGTLAAQMATAIEIFRSREQLARRITDIEGARRRHDPAGKRLQELAAIVESSDDAIISKKLDGTITSWNAAATRILGYTAEEMIGESVLKIIPEHLQSDETLIISKMRAGERLEHFETVRRTKSGELLDVSITVSPMRDETGAIVGASKILRDISARKRLENLLIQAEKTAATGRLAATIAHEINNPLEAVLNLLYLLRPLVERPEAKSYLSTAEIELNRVANIAKQTLGYHREHTSASRLLLTDVAAHAITVNSARCAKLNINIEPRLESSVKIMARCGELTQVLSNLIGNSIQAMPEGGTLRVSVIDVDEPEPGLLLTVTDTGVGIPQEGLARVFESFFTTRRESGTGIGLFVSKKFVEEHGGSISIESSTADEQHGTTVNVFLPLRTPYEEATRPAQP